MATELPSVAVPTPATTTVITTTVKRPIWGRVFDVVMIGAAFAGALLDSLGAFNFSTLGLSERQAAWIGLTIFIVRFALTYRPIKVVDVKAEPANPMGGSL